MGLLRRLLDQGAESFIGLFLRVPRDNKPNVVVVARSPRDPGKSYRMQNFPGWESCRLDSELSEAGGVPPWRQLILTRGNETFALLLQISSAGALERFAGAQARTPDGNDVLLLYAYIGQFPYLVRVITPAYLPIQFCQPIGTRGRRTTVLAWDSSGPGLVYQVDAYPRLRDCLRRVNGKVTFQLSDKRGGRYELDFVPEGSTRSGRPDARTLVQGLSGPAPNDLEARVFYNRWGWPVRIETRAAPQPQL